MPKVRLRRVFQFSFCGGFVEIYKVVPRPAYDGGFVLSFRKKWQRKILPLFGGITTSGARAVAKDLKEHRYNQTELRLLIAEKQKHQLLVAR